MTSLRIQLRRAKGWRMPPNTVKVDRTTKWGNPHRVGLCAVCGIDHESADEAVAEFAAEMRNAWMGAPMDDGLTSFGDFMQKRLRGKSLACWCRLCEKHREGKPLGVKCDECSPCHADVLLEVANREDGAK